MVDFDRNVYCLLGLPFDAVDMASAIRCLRTAARDRTAYFIATPNVNFLVASLTDESFRDSVIQSDLSLMDGMPLVWIARLLRVPIRERLSGSTLLEELRADVSSQLAVFFFGGAKGVAEAACRRLHEESSGLSCAGFLAPGFVSVEEMSSNETIARINESQADFLVVSLGARKGLAWIERNREGLAVPVVSHLGAVINFIAGTVNRAPKWMQHTGLEWLWRIKEEPGLWRRYTSDARVLVFLLSTRVLPLAWYLWRHRPTKTDLECARVETEQDRGIHVLRLGGAWQAHNLGALRSALSAAAATAGDVRLDMAGVGYVDSAFLGLVLLLHGSLKRQKRRLYIVSIRKSVRKMFKYCLADNLLQSPS